MSSKDYGYEAIPWEESNTENVAAVEAEYRDRLDETATAWDDLEQKGRFILVSLIAAITALSGWAFANILTLSAAQVAGLLALSGSFSVASMFAALSLLPKRMAFSRGVTPHDLNVERWKPLLIGEAAEYRRFQGVRIREYARSIESNSASLAKKSRRLKTSLAISVSAPPISVAAFALVFALEAFIHPTHSARLAPVLLGSASLLLGLLVLWWFGRRWRVGS
jgi:hypothetical protein